MIRVRKQVCVGDSYTFAILTLEWSSHMTYARVILGRSTKSGSSYRCETAVMAPPL